MICRGSKGLHLHGLLPSDLDSLDGSRVDGMPAEAIAL